MRKIIMPMHIYLYMCKVGVFFVQARLRIALEWVPETVATAPTTTARSAARRQHSSRCGRTRLESRSGSPRATLATRAAPIPL